MFHKENMINTLRGVGVNKRMRKRENEGKVNETVKTQVVY